MKQENLIHNQSAFVPGIYDAAQLKMGIDQMDFHIDLHCRGLPFHALAFFLHNQYGPPRCFVSAMAFLHLHQDLYPEAPGLFPEVHDPHEHITGYILKT